MFLLLPNANPSSMSEGKSLTLEELIALTEVVAAERERIRQLIIDNPHAMADNEVWRAYVSKLDFLTKRLMENIGTPRKS